MLINQKKKDGIPLSEREQELLKEAPRPQARFAGGVQDATIEEGLAAGAKGDLMLAQDKLNKLIQDGITSGPKYADAVKGVQDAQKNAALLGGDPMAASMQSVHDVIADQLVPEVAALIKALGGIVPPDITMKFNDADAKGEIETIKGEINGIPTSFTVTAYANIAPASNAIYQLGRLIPHSPAEEGPFAKEPNWQWVFDGLSTEAKAATADATDSLAAFNDLMQSSGNNMWNFILSNLNDIVSGKKRADLQKNFDLLNEQWKLAIEDKAPQSIIDGLQSAMEADLTQLKAIGGVMGSQVVQGMQEQLATQKWADALDKGMTDIGANWGDLLSGALRKKLEQDISDLSDQIESLTAAGASDSVINGLKTSLAEKQAELIDVGKLVATPIVQGLEQQLAKSDWTQTLGGLYKDALSNPSDIGSGAKLKDLMDQRDILDEQLRLAQALGQTDLVKQYTSDLQEVNAEINIVIQAMQTGIAGVGYTAKLTTSQIAQISATLQDAGDSATALIPGVVKAIEDGRLDLQTAAKLIRIPSIPRLRTPITNSKRNYNRRFWTAPIRPRSKRTSA